MYTIAVIVVLYFYVRLGMWVARKAASRWERKRIKWGVRIAVALAFILIPTGDWIAGRIYFNHLCETEAGVKVYQTIELPDEYWNEDGTPKFYDENNGNFYLNWDELVDAEMIKTNKIFNIVEMRSILQEKSSGKIIREKVWFGFKGGWIKIYFSPTLSGSNCGRSVASTLSEYAELFEPSSKQEGVGNDNSQ